MSDKTLIRKCVERCLELTSNRLGKLTTLTNTAMGTGSMPPSLLVDAVHLNSAGYMILGWKLYERMKNVGYID